MKTKYDLKSVRHAKTLATAALVAASAVSANAFAADGAVDTSGIIATINQAGVAAAAIGVAVLSMHYGIKLYKWIKAAG